MSPRRSLAVTPDGRSMPGAAASLIDMAFRQRAQGRVSAVSSAHLCARAFAPPGGSGTTQRMQRPAGDSHRAGSAPKMHVQFQLVGQNDRVYDEKMRL